MLAFDASILRPVLLFIFSITGIVLRDHFHVSGKIMVTNSGCKLVAFTSERSTHAEDH